MKDFIKLLVIPIVIVIIGTNYIIQYRNIECASNNSSLEYSKDEMDKHKIVIDREVELVPDYFLCYKHDWYIRLGGILIIFLPFIISTDTIFKWMLLNDSKAAGELIFKAFFFGEGAAQSDLNWIKFFIIILFNTAIILLGYYFDISLFQYVRFIYEKCLNLILHFV